MKQNNGNVDALRYYARELIREFGFLGNPYQALDLNFAKVHLLLECEQQGVITQQVLANNLRLNKSYISKLVKSLESKQLLIAANCPSDSRVKNISLTKEGKELITQINHAAQAQVLAALNYLDEQDVSTIKQGLNLYANALKKSRRLQGIRFRSIEKRDNTNLSNLIKLVLTEFGANKPGFAFCDAELSIMFEAYQGKDKIYLVAEKANELLGGVGIGPLSGVDKSIGELKKMYLSSAARGLGVGDELLRLALAAAAEKNYCTVYLETLSSMTQAISLYRRHGFEFLNTPLGQTGHFSCDTWMQKKIV
jgi:putative acetyltransferase